MVAAQVHCDTMTDAMRPVLMLRPAVLNHSELSRVPTYRRSSHTCIAKTSGRPQMRRHPKTRRLLLKVMPSSTDSTVITDSDVQIEDRDA